MAGDEKGEAAEIYDYVIVGAGSAGCVLAARLTEDPSMRVLLLEAGPVDRNPFVKVPAAFPRLFESRLDWAYLTEPQAELRDRRIFWPRGKVLGGSSSMNAMMWIRGFAADYDAWADLVGPTWSYDAVVPFFVRAERTEGATADHPHLGRNGPIAIAFQRDPNLLTRAWIDAAHEQGIGANNSRNSGSEEGVSTAMVTQRHGRRVSVADAYLRPARHRRNLVVRTNASCRAVEFEQKRAIGVTYRVGRELHRALARREVLLSCGAVSSPQLLMVSGVGPGKTLHELGLSVVAEHRDVGENLQDHLVAGIALAAHGRAGLTSRPPLSALVRYLLFGRGLLTSNIAEGYGFVRSDDRLALSDLELLFVPALYLDQGRTLPRRHGATLAAVLLTPESRGRLTIGSADPEARPHIDPGYLTDRDGRDAARLRFGIERCLALATSPALAQHLGAAVQPRGALDSALVEESLRGYAQSLYHPVGTARMGRDAHSVVDEQLFVRGVSGLRVVDASVMPTIPRGHTHAPTVMIAERAAELIKSSR